MKKLSLEEFRHLSVKEEIDYIDSLENWGDIDSDCYVYLCDRLGINYHSYNDPDKLFEAIKKKAIEEKAY